MRPPPGLLSLLDGPPLLRLDFARRAASTRFAKLRETPLVGASFGCVYLWYTARTTQSGFTESPYSSRR